LIDGRLPTFLADGIIGVTSCRAVHSTGHPVGQRQEKAFYKGTSRRFANGACFHSTADELTDRSKGIFGKVRGRIVDLQDVPAGVGQFG